MDADGPRPADGDPVEHLWNAAHEVLRAFRTLIDAADEFVESQRADGSAARAASGAAGRAPGAGRVHRIDIDRDDGRADDRDGVDLGLVDAGRDDAGRDADAPGGRAGTGFGAS